MLQHLADEELTTVRNCSGSSAIKIRAIDSIELEQLASRESQNVAVSQAFQWAPNRQACRGPNFRRIMNEE